MRTYYFDKKNGVAVRDKAGLAFPTTSAAIEHSKKLASQLRTERTGSDNLYISVINEAGTEVHREPVYPDRTPRA
jgi:hypothetical protein